MPSADTDIPKPGPWLNGTVDLTDRIEAARERWRRCQIIAGVARDQGLNASPERVNYNYARWEAWYQGRLATGYLMRITGVGKIRT